MPSSHLSTASGRNLTTGVSQTKARAEPAEVVRLVPGLERRGAAVRLAPVIGARASGILAGAGISWIEPDGDCRLVIGSRPSSASAAAGQRAARRTRRAPGRRRPLLGRRPPDRPVSPDRGRPLGRSLTWPPPPASRRASPAGPSRCSRGTHMLTASGASRVTDRDALLAAWASAPAPGDAVLERVVTVGCSEAIRRAIRALDGPPRGAITAEAAADRLAPFARFARVELYVTDAAAWDEALELMLVARGGTSSRSGRPTTASSTAASSTTASRSRAARSCTWTSSGAAARRPRRPRSCASGVSCGRGRSSRPPRVGRGGAACPARALDDPGGVRRPDDDRRRQRSPAPYRGPARRPLRGHPRRRPRTIRSASRTTSTGPSRSFSASAATPSSTSPSDGFGGRGPGPVDRRRG